MESCLDGGDERADEEMGLLLIEIVMHRIRLGVIHQDQVSWASYSQPRPDSLPRLQLHLVNVQAFQIFLLHFPPGFTHHGKVAHLVEGCGAWQAQGLNAQIDDCLHGGVGQAAVLAVAGDDQVIRLRGDIRF